MDLKASSQDLSPSDCASDSEEKEISEGEDEDDDRNHKHRKREAGSQPLDGDFLNQVSTRPYRKRKPFDNGFPYREGDPQSGETSKNHYGASERNFSTRSERDTQTGSRFLELPWILTKELGETNHFQLKLALYLVGEWTLSPGVCSIPGLAWLMSQLQWSNLDLFLLACLREGDCQTFLMHTIYLGMHLEWFRPGVPNGGLDGLRLLGFQGALRQSINPTINIGLPRQRCRDFEERGFSLRGVRRYVPDGTWC